MECSLSVNGNVSRLAFHNLTSHCENDKVSDYLVYPATFFIQLIRFSLGICVIVILLAVYNSISVMNRHILSTAACSLYWVFMALMVVLKSSVLMIFPILAWKVNITSPSSTQYTSLDTPLFGEVGGRYSALDPTLYEEKEEESMVLTFNMTGFILQAVLQSAAGLFLFLALDHEYRFRSSDYATADTPTKHCIAMSCSLKLFCSWPRLVALLLTAAPLMLLVAIEVVFHHRPGPDHSMPPYLLWAYIITLPLTRLACLAMGVALVSRCKEGKLKPSVPAKVYLIGGLVLSLMEDFPNFVISCQPQFQCQLHKLSVFDLLQLLGILSLLFFVFFVRSQYLRVEQESKLSLVWDLQKLLQVNGRRDIIRHYNT